jgi:hypothetical protein
MNEYEEVVQQADLLFWDIQLEPHRYISIKPNEAGELHIFIGECSLGIGYQIIIDRTMESFFPKEKTNFATVLFAAMRLAEEIGCALPVDRCNCEAIKTASVKSEALAMLSNYNKKHLDLVLNKIM